MTTWKNLRKELTVNDEDENTIELEKNLIRTMVNIREEKGLPQVQLAEINSVKQL